MKFDIGLDNFSSMDPSALVVVLIGIGTVFLGLICLIVVCAVMGIGRSKGDSAKETNPSDVAPVSMAIPTVIPNKQELLAAISVAVAEELSTDVNAIRIHSIRQLTPGNGAVSHSDKQALIAAISAAVAEDLGTDVNAIRVHSIKQI